MGDKQHGSVELLAQAASGLAQLPSREFIHAGEGLIHPAPGRTQTAGAP